MSDLERPKAVSTGGVDRRRDRRIPFRLGAVFCTARKDFAADIEDVSYRGMLVRTDAPLSVRQLVQLRVALPPDGRELTTTGMVTRCVAREGGVSPGAGIQLYALSPEQRERWNRFIRFAVSEAQPATAPATPPAEPQPAPPPRQYARYAATLQVRLNTTDELHLLYSENLSMGGIFVRTDLELAAETPVKLAILHPKTGEQYQLEAVVRRCSRAPLPGLGLEFTNMTEQRRGDFLEFVRSEIPVEEVTYVKPE